MKNLFIFSFLLFTILSCKEERKFPEVKKLSEFEETVFIPTLEHKISQNKNTIYSSSLLYAWDEIKNIIDKPIEISKNLYDLSLLNESITNKNSLNK